VCLLPYRAGRDAPLAAPPAPGPIPNNATGGWQSGLFDKGSWMESQAGWARTVVAGRARLGGIPVGVVAVETQTVMRCLPADPGMPDSCESVVPQAGQVRVGHWAVWVWGRAAGGGEGAIGMGGT
jgi:acetyl-CoA carboxylase/biotin carboxylase 1